jgi:hypothetical protein
MLAAEAARLMELALLAGNPVVGEGLVELEQMQLVGQEISGEPMERMDWVAVEGEIMVA